MRRSAFSHQRNSNHGEPLKNFIRDATAPEKTNQTQHIPTSETLKPRRDISDLIIDAEAVEPKPRVRLTANITTVICNTYHPLIPSGLCTRRLKENGNPRVHQRLVEPI
jgi:RNase P subunit RPR2